MSPGARLLLVNLVGFLLASPLAATELQILLRPRGETPIEGSSPAQIVLEALDGPPNAETLTREVAPPGPLELDLPAGRTYRLSVLLPGFYAADRIVHTEDETQDLSVSLFPTGTISGDVEVPGGNEIPETLTVSLSSPPGSGSELPAGEVSCPIQESRFRCEVPAGVADLRLRFHRHIGHYFWAVKIEEHGELDLGTLVLRRGASIVGWVLAPARDFNFREVKVIASPQLLGDVTHRSDLERRSLLQWETTVNPRGFFELPGVQPGSYVVQVAHPKYATATVAPVTVLPDAETQLREIELQLPASLEVHVWPPHHPLSRWLLSLHRRSPVPGYSDQAEEGTASEEGRWRISGLEPGSYFLRVRDRRGSSWAQEDLEVQPGMAPVEVRLPMMRLEGEVVFRGEPLAADLFFGGRRGAQSVRITSNEEGKFYVFLPQRKSWFVDIVSSEPPIEARVEDVHFHQAENDRWAKTHIEVPDTRVAGHVVDPAGQPVPGARVRAAGPAFRSVSTETSAPSGAFELLGLQPGPWNLEASLAEEDRRRSSERLRLELEDGEERTSLRLVLLEERRLTGAVIGPDGHGVPGATVLTFPLANGLRASDRLPTEASDVEGVFELSLPARADEVWLSVFPPGFAATQLRVDLDSEAPLLISVDDVGGTLTVRYDGELTRGERVRGLRARTLIFASSFLLGSQALESWARAHGNRQAPDRFVVPRLAPGVYVACLDAGTGPFLTGRPPADGEGCVSGTLAPYGELELVLGTEDE